MIKMKLGGYSILGIGLFVTNMLFASPAGIEQSLLNAEQVPPPATPPKPVKQPARPPRTKAEKIARLKELLKKPEMRAAFERMMKHPNLTFTPKSVFTPAGVPMSWGGIGFSGGVVNRFPTATQNTWPGGASVALPFGDSDKTFGGVVGVNFSNFTNNIYYFPSNQSNTGTVSLAFSRWLSTNMIATVGIINLGPWGILKEAPKSYNGAVTYMFGADLLGGYHLMSASVGLGSGAFVPIGQTGSATDGTVYPFANAAFNVTRQFAFVADYYENSFAVGAAYNTATTIPFSFMLYGGNLRPSTLAPYTMFGLRVSTGMALPTIQRAS